MGVIIAAQAGFFLAVLSGGQELVRADLVVVFEGRPDRAKEAYRLIDQDLAPNLVISPAKEGTLRINEKRFLPVRPFAGIVEDRSRTTLENAVHTKRIMTDHHLKSAILVTSWDHMPRSYFLLRLLCLGSGITVRTHEVATGRLDGSNWFRYRLGWKMVHNEMVEFWGSLLEYAQYRVRGRLPESTPGRSNSLGTLKQWLLFEIHERSLVSAPRPSP